MAVITSSELRDAIVYAYSGRKLSPPTHSSHTLSGFYLSAGRSSRSIRMLRQRPSKQRRSSVFAGISLRRVSADLSRMKRKSLRVLMRQRFGIPGRRRLSVRGNGDGRAGSNALAVAANGASSVGNRCACRRRCSVAAQGHTTGDWRAIAALESAVSLYASAFAVATVSCENARVTAALTPSFLAMVARALIRRGEFWRCWTPRLGAGLIFARLQPGMFAVGRLKRTGGIGVIWPGPAARYRGPYRVRGDPCSVRG